MRSLLTLIFFLAFYICFSQNGGTIDRTYGTNGYTQMTIGANTSDRLYDVRTAGTGKLYYIANDYNIANNLIVGRLDTTGNKDKSFGQQGAVNIPGISIVSKSKRIVKYKDVVADVNDTSVIVVTCDGTNQIKLHKFNDHGDYDLNFGTNGIVTFTSIKPVYEIGESLFQPDGKILLDMGSVNSPYNSSADILIARLQPDGSPDNSFGTNGITRIDQSFSFCTDVCDSTRDYVGDMSYTTDGKIIVVSALDGLSAYKYGGVFKLNANGTIDKTFGSNGFFPVYNSGWEILPKSISVQGDYFYICFNQINYLSGVNRSNVVRYTVRDGRYDPTFNSVYMPVLPGYSVGKVLDMQMQPDKKVNVLCASGTAWGSKPYVVRLKRYGNIDSTFGKNGIAVIDTLSLLPATDINEDVLTYFDQDLQGRLTIGTSVQPPANYDLLFTRLAIGDMPGLNTPVANAGPDQTFCAGSTITVGTPGTDDFDYFWNFAGSSGSPLFTVPNPTFTDYTSGDFVLTVANVLGVYVTDTVKLTTLAAPPAPTLSGGYPYFCIGSSFTMTSSASSNNQWFKDGVAIPGATGQTYSATQSGKYTVQVSNGTCSSSSLALDVTASPIPPPPTLSTSGTSLCNNTSITLTSSASVGNRWYVDGVLNPSQARQTYVVSQSGTYTTSAIVNGCESGPSNAITITSGTVATPIISASGPLSFCSGSSVTLTSSAASGNQWYKDNVLINGASSQTYMANQSGSYQVKVTNGSCSSTSTAITVSSVSQPATPTITASGSVAICTGSNVVLSSSASTGNQWYKDGTIIAGASSQNYTATIAGSYTVVAGSGGCPSNPSAAVNIAVNALPSAPVISYSGSTSFCNGGNLSLSSSAASGNQWYKDGASISNATAQNYIATQTGVYTVKATSGSCTSPASTGISVNVTTVSTPVISASGSSTVCQGSTVALRSSAALGNQWYKDGVSINGATDSTYSATQSGSYTTKATSSGCTSSASNAIAVTVNAVPAQPVITQSGNILSSSAATGNQWYKDGVAIAGATGSSYAPTVAGQYAVSVTVNGCTSPLSASINFVATAINSPSLDNHIQIAPNPVHDYLNIQYNGNPAAFTLWIIDLNGRQLMLTNFSNATTVDLRKITGGVYVVTVANVRNGEHVQRLIIKL